MPNLRFHILTAGFTSPNGRAFLFPLIVFRDALKEAGFDLRLFRSVMPALFDCDVLGVDSKHDGVRWIHDSAAMEARFADFSTRVPRLIYFDIHDSTGTLEPRVLPHVDLYCKGQLLRDRSRYLRPFYGHRIYTDYCHEVFGVEDSPPQLSRPVKDFSHLKKLRVSWNSGLADYSLLGPARMAIFDQIPLKSLLRFPNKLWPAGTRRQIDVSCRFGVSHSRPTVAWQRQHICEKLAGHFSTVKLSRRAYLRELGRAKLVVSPFGYGEITLKDFETFLSGGLLLKPDMRHMETWPDLFRTGETMITHRWDLEDLEAVIEDALTDYESMVAIAFSGQQTYLSHTCGTEAGALFAERFSELVSDDSKV